MKKVLITGANSYIGESFERWVTERYPDEFQVDTVDMIDGSGERKALQGTMRCFIWQGLHIRKKQRRMHHCTVK